MSSCDSYCNGPLPIILGCCEESENGPTRERVTVRGRMVTTGSREKAGDMGVGGGGTGTAPKGSTQRIQGSSIPRDPSTTPVT